jgi:UPF0716 protein FxsA
MVRLRYAAAGLLAVPLVDAALLVFVAGAIGWVATILLVVLTGLLGMFLVRAEGRHTLRKLQRKTARGEPPTDELLDGAFLIAAGAFLLTPGLVTDAIGLLFVVPLSRYPLRELVRKYLLVPYLDEKAEGFVTGNVYTGGFPDDESGTAGGFVGFGDGGFPGGGSGTDDTGSGRDSQGSDDVYDVSDDEYSVEE